MVILTSRGWLTRTCVKLVSRCLGPSIVRFRSLHCKSLEIRGVSFGKLVNESFCWSTFFHPLLEDRAVVISSIKVNFMWPLINTRVPIMEKTEVKHVISETAEGFMKGTQDLESMYMTRNVTGVNHEDSPVNQSSFSQEQSPSNSRHDMKVDQCLSTEACVLDNKSVKFSNDSSNQNYLGVDNGSECNLIASDLQLREACMQAAGTAQLSNESPNLNLPDVVIEGDGEFNVAEVDDDETVNNKNSSSFQSVFDEDDVDEVSDGDSLGLDTLFDESLQCTVETRVTIQGKTRARKQNNRNKQGLVCDQETFGLESLFDEDLQRRDAARWAKPQSKLTSRQRNREKRKRKRKLSGLSDDDDTNTSVSKDESPTAKPKKKPKRTVPNYFVAIRVSDPHIHAGIKIVQDSVVAQDEKLKPALIPLATLHLTLMVVHLENDEQIQKATDILHGCRSSLEPILLRSTLTLNFSGLDHFRHQVLFVKVCGEEEIAALNSVANIVRETFAKEGIPSTDARDFNPHLTVMKLTRSPKLRKKGIKKIPVESYSSWVDLSFGEELVSALHLCSMNAKDKDGFYKCVATLKFEPDSQQDTEVCSGPESVPMDNSGDALENSIEHVTEQQEKSASSVLCDTDASSVGHNVEDSTSCINEQEFSKDSFTCVVDNEVEYGEGNQEE